MLLWWSKPSDPPLVWSDPSRVCLAVFFEPWHCFRCRAVLPWVVLPSTRMSLRLFHVNQSGSCGDRHSFWFPSPTCTWLIDCIGLSRSRVSCNKTVMVLLASSHRLMMIV